MNLTPKIRWTLIILLILSAAIRAFIAGVIELGNDEVYYITYAKYPDLSHFDHPAMVGWVIQLFSLDLRFTDEIFIRLAAVVFGTINTLLIFLIGKQIKNPLTGLYAALLYTASFYGFVLCGLFILPDGPQSLFWLLSLYLLLLVLPDRAMPYRKRNLLLLAGLTVGMAILSKYHAVALISGVFFYLLFHQRRWFGVPQTWLAFFIALLCTLPILIWNYNNDFISFTFHESRITPNETQWIRPEYVATELIGQFFYNNPINVILIIGALFALVNRRKYLQGEYLALILWISVPLVAVFLVFSLFRQTLPHWSGPAYFGFMLIAAAWLADRMEQRGRSRLIPVSVGIALALLLSVLVVATGQIRKGWIPLQKWGAEDITLDMTGWDQLGRKFEYIYRYDQSLNRIHPDSPILTFRWFPAANIEYYVASRTGQEVYAFGSLERIHKYAWINDINGYLKPGTDAYYLGFSDDYRDPYDLYGSRYDTIIPSDTIPITRGKDLARVVVVYRLIGKK